ncbi:hypothetical protein JTB14_032905 [Gonioctena quinquepunctata]|nr:hypothetical protein JTB14_032905 [Gonioctena quinquepunctata]
MIAEDPRDSLRKCFWEVGEMTANIPVQSTICLSVAPIDSIRDLRYQDLVKLVWFSVFTHYILGIWNIWFQLLAEPDLLFLVPSDSEDEPEETDEGMVDLGMGDGIHIR